MIELGLVVGLLVVVGAHYLYKDSGDNGEDGCGGHHYGDWEPTGQIRGTRRLIGVWNGKYVQTAAAATDQKRVFQIEEHVVKECEHDGCYKEKTGWLTKGYVEPEKLNDVVGFTDD